MRFLTVATTKKGQTIRLFSVPNGNKKSRETNGEIKLNAT